MNSTEVILLAVALAGLWLLWMIAMRLNDISIALNKQLKLVADSIKERPAAAPQVYRETNAPVQHIQSDYCNLMGVDDETAAIIMAIISEQFPNEMLKFVSIKAL